MNEVKQYNNKNVTAAYIAGSFDGDSEIHIGISRKDTYHLGYRISLRIQMKRQWPFALSEVDEFCINNSIKSTLNQEDGEFVLRINKAEHIEHFLKLIFPYVYDKREEVAHLVEEVTPRLKNGEFYRDKEEFVEVMEVIDVFRELSHQDRWSKYTAEYFRDEFGVSENDEPS